MTSPVPPLPEDDPTAALLAEAGWIRAMAGRLARDQAEADDVAQGTLALALERGPGVRTGLRPWLARVAARVARHRRRAEARRGHREAEAARADTRAGTSCSAEQLFQRVEAQGRLAALVRSLPAPYAEVVLRRYYEEQTADEIAAAMGGSAATARSRLARGLDLLRQSLTGPGGDSAGHGAKLFALAAGFPGTLCAPSPLPTVAALIAMKVSTKAAASMAALLVFLTAITLIVGTGRAPIEPLGTGSPADLAVGEPQALRSGSRSGSRSGAHGAAQIAGPAADATRTAMAPASQGKDDAASPKNEGPPTASIVRARLVDPQGQPLPGALLSYIYRNGRPRGTAGGAAADEDGRVVLQLADGALRLWGREVLPITLSASINGRATRFIIATPIRHGEADLGDIKLLPGGTVRGTVVDGSGRGIPDALIYAGDAIVAGDLEAQRLSGPVKEKARPRADADPAGRFLCKGVPTGEGRLWVHAQGFLWTLTDPVQVTPGQVLDMGSVVLEPIPEELTIVGTVLSPEGAPVAGATVSFESPSGDGSIKTLEDGRFTIYPKSRFGMRLSASTPNGRYGASRMLQVLPGARPELRLSVRHSIQVTVVDGKGRGIPDTSLMTVIPVAKGQSGFAGGFRPIPGSDWIKTDSQGQADVPALGQTFAITVFKDRYELQRAGPFGLEELPTELTITLVKVPTLQGRVTHLGEPVVGAEVQVARRIEDFISLEQGFPMRLFKGSVRTYYAGDDGRFDCPIDTNSGAMTLLVLSDGLATAELDVDLPTGQGTDGIEIEMTAGGCVRGTLLAPPGEDPRKLIVAASRGDGEVKWTRPNAEGHYQLAHLTPGPWRIEGRDREPASEIFSAANSDEEKDFKWNVDIREDETSSFDVDMRQLGDVEIHGRLTLDGAPAKGWVVTVKAPISATIEKSAPTAATSNDGRFLLVARSGKYHLQLEGELPGGAQVTVMRDVELKGQRLDVDVPVVTGTLEDSVSAGTRQVRLVRGSGSRGDHEITIVPVAADGTLRVRVPAGKASLQTPLEGVSMFNDWRYERMVEVTPE